MKFTSIRILFELYRRIKQNKNKKLNHFFQILEKNFVKDTLTMIFL